jgi:hypothetical protein
MTITEDSYVASAYAQFIDDMNSPMNNTQKDWYPKTPQLLKLPLIHL